MDVVVVGQQTSDKDDNNIHHRRKIDKCESLIESYEFNKFGHSERAKFENGSRMGKKRFVLMSSSPSSSSSPCCVDCSNEEISSSFPRKQTNVKMNESSQSILQGETNNDVGNPSNIRDYNNNNNNNNNNSDNGTSHCIPQHHRQNYDEMTPNNISPQYMIKDLEKAENQQSSSGGENSEADNNNNNSNSRMYFRPLRPSDRSVIQSLHERWFPVRYKSEFYDSVVMNRMFGTNEPLYSCVVCELLLAPPPSYPPICIDTQYDNNGENISNGKQHNSWDGAPVECFSVDANLTTKNQQTSVGDFKCNALPSSSTDFIPGNRISKETNLCDNENILHPNGDLAALPTHDTKTQFVPQQHQQQHYHDQTQNEQRIHTHANDADSLHKAEQGNIRPSSAFLHFQPSLPASPLPNSEQNAPNLGECELIHSETIAGCIVGTFLDSNRSDSEVVSLMVPNRARHTRMFYIMTLGTVERYRKRGLASTLVQRSLAMARSDSRCGVAYLHVITYNQGAIRFYEKLGFARVKEIQDYYIIEGVKYNCFVYAKYLNGNRGHFTLMTAVSSFVGSLWKRLSDMIFAALVDEMDNDDY